MSDSVTALRVFEGKSVLVTGGSGFLASNLVERLMSVDCRITQVTRSATLPPARARHGTRTHLTGDIRERSLWTHVLADADFVFHFAAQTSVYAAGLDPADDWRANVQPMLHLLETCRERDWHPGILFAGTVTQVGLPEHLPVDETFPDRPVTIYDWHKLMAETYLEHYIRQGWARGGTLRLANLYGPGPLSGAQERGVLNQMIQRAMRGEPLALYGGGSQLRDYLFVTDAVEAFVAAAAHLDRVNGRHFVLGSGTGHPLAEAFKLVAERVALLTGREEVPVVSLDLPAGLSPIEDRNFVADISQFCAATGWCPRTTLVHGIDITAQACVSTSKQLST